MKYSLLAATSLTAVLLTASSALAATSDTGSGNGSASGSMAVSATVSVTCTVSGGPLAFGTYASSAATTGSSTISVSCDGVPSITPYIAVDGGQNTSTSGSTVRNMANSVTTVTDLLAYSLATTTSGTDLTNGATVAATQTSGDQTITLYGKIASAQKVQAGSYADTVALTLTY